MTEVSGWYAAVSSGGGHASYLTDWPRGPWRSKEAGQEAIGRWAARRGIDAKLGTIRAAHHLRVVGPFRTRAIARKADVSDYSDSLMTP